MPEDHKIIFNHILEAILEIQDFSQNIKTVEEPVFDRKTIRAIEQKWRHRITDMAFPTIFFLNFFCITYRADEGAEKGFRDD